MPDTPVRTTDDHQMKMGVLTVHGPGCSTAVGLIRKLIRGTTVNVSGETLTDEAKNVAVESPL